MQITPPRSKPKRLIGIDFGLSRLGLALSDERQIIASPLETLRAEKKTEQTVEKLLKVIDRLEAAHHCSIEAIIIGLPLMMSGKIGFQADEVRHFIAILSASTPIPIHTWDERLSTVQADRALREGQMSRKKRAQSVDIVSAAIILQSYLDCQYLSKPSQ